MKKILLLLTMMILTFSIVACSNDTENKNTNGVETEKDVEKTETKDTEKQVLKIGAIPDQEVSLLNTNMEHMAEYLSEKTGMEVEYVPTVDYASLVTGFERGDINLAWFGGLTGVQAMNLVKGTEAIAQRPRDEKFHSVFIAQKGLNLEKLEDLKGKSFTFGSESSTSGHLMPRYFLTEAGIDPEKDLSGVPNYSGSHDKTYSLVESGAFQAGALNEAVWEKALEENKVDLTKIDVFYTTPDYYDYHWGINSDDVTVAKVKEALLSMDQGDANAKSVLEFFQTDKFIETKNENYEKIEEVAKKLGLVK